MAEPEPAEKDACSDDGFEVLDPEPDAEDDKCLSTTTEHANPGTIIFCHMEEEFDDIRHVTCQYVRPENWTELPQDEIAIFEVGWITVLEAVVRLPADTNYPVGFPLGTVSLKDITLPEEDYVNVPGAVSYFQFCYLRNGEVLGAGTPFVIHGIKASEPEYPLLNQSDGPDTDKVPASVTATAPSEVGEAPVDAKVVGSAGSARPDNSQDAEQHLLCDTYLEQSHRDPVDLSVLRNTISNMSKFTKKLEPNASGDNASGSDESTLSAFELKSCLEDLSTSMEKVAEAWSLVASSRVSRHSGYDSDPWRRSPPSPPRSDIASFDSAQTEIVDSERQQGAEIEQKRYVNEKLLVETLNDTRGDHKKTKKKLAEVEAQLVDLKWKLQETEVKYSSGEDKIKEIQSELQVEKKRAVEAEAEIQRLKDELTEKEVKCDELTQRGLKLLSVESDLECANQRLSQEVARRETADAELKRLFDDLVKEQEKNKELEAELQRVTKQLAEKTAKYDHVKKDLSSYKKRMLDEESKCGEAMFELKVVKDELRRREVTFSDTRKELEKAKDDHAHAEAKQYDLLAEARKAKIESQQKIGALLKEQAVIWRQVERVQAEAVMYKEQLDKALFDLKAAQDELELQKAQTTELEESRDAVLEDNAKLQAALVDANEETRKKQESRDEAAEMQKDVMVKELLKKSDELEISNRQLEDLKAELSRVSAERTSIQKDLSDLHEALSEQQSATCSRPCCTGGSQQAEGPGSSSSPGDEVVGSIFQALDEAHSRIRELEEYLETEKKRADSLDDKLQTGAQKHRELFMEKLALEAQLKEFGF